MYNHDSLPQRTTATQDEQHIPFVLYSDPRVPHRSNAFMNEAESPVPMIVHGINYLQLAGAHFGVMVCNTAHIFFDEIVSQTNLPLINMVQNTGVFLAQSHRGVKIGLLATEATVHSQLYAHCFDKLGIEVVAPPLADQELITQAIYNESYGIKATCMHPGIEALQSIAAVGDRMRQSMGLNYLLLGCTELSMAITSEVWHGFEIIDPVKLLAQTCLLKANGTN